MYKNVDSLLENNDDKSADDPFEIPADTMSYRSYMTRESGRGGGRSQDPIETMFEIVADAFGKAPDVVVQTIVFFLGHSINTLYGAGATIDLFTRSQVGTMFQPFWDVEYPVILSRVSFPLRLGASSGVKLRCVIRGYDGPWEDEVFYESPWENIDGPIYDGVVTFITDRELYTHDVARYSIYLEVDNVIGSCSVEGKQPTTPEPLCTLIKRKSDTDEWTLDATQVVCCLLDFTSFNYEDIDMDMSSQIGFNWD